MTFDKPTVFISYSHKDEKWKDLLVQHLRVLGGARDFDVWDDQRIAAGDAWKPQLTRAIETASVAVLLVSVDFLTSAFVLGEEVPKLLRRREQEQLPVVPVIVRPCAWKDIDWLGGSLQVLPKGGKPLSGRSEYALEKSLTSIAREIGALVPRGPWPSAPDAGAAAPGVSGSQHPTTPQPPTSPTRTPEPRPRPARQTPPGAVLSPDVPPAGAIAASAPITYNYYALSPMGGSTAGAIPASTPVTPNPPEPQPAPALKVPPRTSRWRAAPLAVAGALVSVGALYSTYRWVERRPTPAPTPTGAALTLRSPQPLVTPSTEAVTSHGLPSMRDARPEHTSAPAPTPRSAPAVADSVTPPTGVTLHSFEFETVAVSERGGVRERRKLQGQSFIEDLGGGVTLEMVALPGGTFTMGSPAHEPGSDDNERPQRPVTVASFFLGKFEVTQKQWEAVARVAHGLRLDPSHFKGANRPVEQVSWHDALEFCARLGRATGRNYRLPSEAEWEYAARAGTATPFAFGPTITPGLANYDGSHPYGIAAKGEYRRGTTDVGSVGTANAFGLFDMHGNVAEWVQDVWDNSYAGSPDDSRAWEGAGDRTARVLRGGAWGNFASDCRSAARGWRMPDTETPIIGFRVACAVSRTR